MQLDNVVNRVEDRSMEADPPVSQIVAEMTAQIDKLRREQEHVERTISGLIEQRDALARELNDLEVGRTITLAIGRRITLNDEEATAAPPRELPIAVKVPRTIADSAEAALRELGGEAEMKTLVGMLTNEGVLRGQQRRATLSTQLIRHKDRFHNVSRGRWALGPAPKAEIGQWQRFLEGRTLGGSTTDASVVPLGIDLEDD